MMLTDTGPIVAILNRNDRYHAACVDRLRDLRGALLTTWPVITEAMYLLDFSRPAQRALLELIRRGVLQMLPIHSADVNRIRELMEKYEDLPMDFADATLVAIAEREGLSTIFTLDSDFRVYRADGNRPFEVVPSLPR